MSKERPWGNGTPKWTRDATANDSDKSFTVPTGKLWDVREIWAQLEDTVTVGNRLLVVMITNGTDSVWISPRLQGTASQKIVIQLSPAFANYVTTIPTLILDATATNNAQLTCFLPEFVLPAGYVIRVYDYAAIDAAADDLTVVLHYVEYDA